jgi:hypothetical protein
MRLALEPINVSRNLGATSPVQLPKSRSMIASGAVRLSAIDQAATTHSICIPHLMDSRLLPLLL